LVPRGRMEPQPFRPPIGRLLVLNVVVEQGIRKMEYT
jgi:hypothetical protein